MDWWHREGRCKWERKEPPAAVRWAPRPPSLRGVHAGTQSQGSLSHGTLLLCFAFWFIPHALCSFKGWGVMGLFSLFAFFAESSAHPRQKTVWEKHKSQSGHVCMYMENLNSFFDSQAPWKKKIQARRQEASSSDLKCTCNTLKDKMFKKTQLGLSKEVCH